MTALRAFLVARQHRDDAASYALLRAADRRRFINVARWGSLQADRPAPTGFVLTPAAAAPASAGPTGSVLIEVRATYRPGLDTFGGLVPGRAVERWLVAPEAGHWRVQADRVSSAPVLPAPAQATTDVQRWLDRLVMCDSAGAALLQAASPLYGLPALTATPCRHPGDWRAGRPGALTSELVDDSDLVAAYGQDAQRWSRLVPVLGPAGGRFLAVVAPIGDSWRVIATEPVGEGSGG